MPNQSTPIHLSSFVASKELSGAMLTAEVSPCSWMYANYGLQIRVEMKDGGAVTVHERKTDFPGAAASDVEHLLGLVGVCRCSRCGSPAFDPNTVETNRNGLCEACFTKALNEKNEKAAEAVRVEKDLLDAQRKKEGHTHRVNAWIHPVDGVDFQVTLWFKGQPTSAQIGSTLKSKGSVELGDYQVVAL